MKKFEMSAYSRWIAYFLILAAIIALLEMGVRTFESSVSSLQDGALIKLEMFLLRDKTDILFIGTSRTQDGINPTLIAETLGKENPQWEHASAFNAAAAGGSLTRLSYSVDRVISKPGLRLLGIEVSTAQLSDNNSWSPPSFRVKEKPLGIEDTLQDMLSEYLYIIRYRKTFRLENAAKYPLLIFPNIDDGTKWFGQTRGGLFAKDLSLTNEHQSWPPTLAYPLSPVIMEKADLLGGAERYLSVYQQIAARARENGVQLFLYVPPVKGALAINECDERHLRTYGALASVTQAPLLRYPCKGIPPELFQDDSHLTGIGKNLWSARLASDLATTHLITR